MPQWAASRGSARSSQPAAAAEGEREQQKVNELQQEWLEEHHGKLTDLKRTLLEILQRLESLGPEIEKRIQAEEYLGLVRKAFRVWDQADNSGLDADNAIRQAITEAAVSFNANPPDFNDSAVKVRTALEAVGRRGATQIAQRRQAPYPQDSWGRALTLLRQQNVIDQSEEEMVSRTYTFISRGAHIPGITDEEWARLGRTFGISATYFLLKRYLAAP